MGAGWFPGGLVVPGGVDGQFADEFARCGVDDADVQVVHEHEDRSPGVVTADADVVEFPADPEGELAAVPGAVTFCHAAFMILLSASPAVGGFLLLRALMPYLPTAAHAIFAKGHTSVPRDRPTSCQR